jgi:hypothetical protein
MMCGISLFLALILGQLGTLQADSRWVTYPGSNGPGAGKHIVLVSGDEEYRSEEALPQLGKILAKYHGFTCTVLFAIDPKDGTINPEIKDNIPGLEHLKDADLLVLFTRFRDLPDDQMRYFVKYVLDGKPIVGMRTSTHAFALSKNRKYQAFHWQSKEWTGGGGFGRRVLGETWVSHHGHHGVESTRGIIAPGQEMNPILRGIKSGDIWGPTDVYGINLPLPGDSRPLVLGEVLSGMHPTDAPVGEQVEKSKSVKKNDPMMPIAWTKTYELVPGKKGRVFTTTMGASTDLNSAGLRRLLVNACYWAVGLEEKIPAESQVDLVGEFHPSPFKFGGHIKGKKPADHVLEK